MLAFSDYLEEKAKKTSVKINPTKEEIKEAMDFEEFDALTDEELEIVMEELITEMMIDEGLELDEVLDIFGADDMLMEASEGRWERVKSAAKKAGRAIARGVGYAGGLAKRAVKAAGSEMKKGYERGSKGSESSSSSSGSSSSSSSGSSAPAAPEKDRSAAKARLNRMRMAKVKRGIKKVAGKTARLAQKGASAVSKGADKVAKRLGEEHVQHIGGALEDGGLEVITYTQEDLDEGKKGLWDNIHAKRKRGEKPAKPGDKNYPETLKVEGYDKPDEKIKTDRDGYRVPQKDADAAKARLLAKAKAKRAMKEAHGMHRDAKTGEVVDKAEVGKTYYPNMPKKKSSVALRKEKEAMKKEETIVERGDFWHPDPDKDKKLGGPGANQRAREDRAEKSKPKSDPKKLRPGESYMDYAKRQKAGKSSYKSSGSTARERLTKAGAKLSPPREGLRDKLKRKLGLKKEEFAMTEGRAEDAKASLEKVKARQKVLDAHEKKTGKKLDITKTPEHKAHKQNFPGAKRQEKKVKGAKETPAEKHNRQVQTYTDRLKKYGKTKKQAAYDKAMSKHTSRFD